MVGDLWCKDGDGDEPTDIDDSDLDRLVVDAGWGSAHLSSERGTQSYSGRYEYSLFDWKAIREWSQGQYKASLARK